MIDHTQSSLITLPCQGVNVKGVNHMGNWLKWGCIDPNGGGNWLKMSDKIRESLLKPKKQQIKKDPQQDQEKLQYDNLKSLNLE